MLVSSLEMKEVDKHSERWRGGRNGYGRVTGIGGRFQWNTQHQPLSKSPPLKPLSTGLDVRGKVKV